MNSIISHSMATLSLPITIDLVSETNSVGCLGGPSGLGGLSGSSERRDRGGLVDPATWVASDDPACWLA